MNTPTEQAVKNQVGTVCVYVGSAVTKNTVFITRNTQLCGITKNVSRCYRNVTKDSMGRLAQVCSELVGMVHGSVYPRADGWLYIGPLTDYGQ